MPAATTEKIARPTKARTPRVGDRVLLSFGGEDEEGVIVEDRGPIGVGGRRLYRIEFEFDPSSRTAIELPATEFRLKP